MSDTALDHPLVRDYLRGLDAAFAGTPAGPARELREQITAHLEDALPPAASDEEVAAALARLGSPADLAAEAGAGAPAAAPVPAPSLLAEAWRRMWAALGRRTWRFWSIAAAIVILAGSITGYVTSIQYAGVPQFSGAFGWWGAQDAKAAVETSADGVTQSTAPNRPGQRQGFFLEVYNPSDWTMTVVGYAGTWGPSGTSFAQVAVSVKGSEYGGQTYDPRTTHYGLPGTIPPHQFRILRLLWTGAPCLQVGGSEGIDQLVLRVRMGLLTRTEVVMLGQGYFVSGTQARCP
jgi:hypothetical protein